MERDLTMTAAERLTRITERANAWAEQFTPVNLSDLLSLYADAFTFSAAAENGAPMPSERIYDDAQYAGDTLENLRAWKDKSK